MRNKELLYQVIALRIAGYTYADIGLKVSRTTERIRQILQNNKPELSGWKWETRRPHKNIGKGRPRVLRLKGNCWYCEKEFTYLISQKPPKSCCKSHAALLREREKKG